MQLLQNEKYPLFSQNTVITILSGFYAMNHNFVIVHVMHSFILNNTPYYLITIYYVCCLKVTLPDNGDSKYIKQSSCLS